MANYNTKRIYNKSVINNGANYNSAPFILLIVDNGLGIDNIASVINNIDILDDILTSESITSIASVNISDNSISVNDEINVTNNVDVSDTMEIEDNIFVIGNVNIAENGYGLDFISLATTYFFIGSDNILNPLGVLKTRDTREEILPSLKNYTESVPGKHGEYKFKTELKGKILELTVITKKGLTPKEKDDLKKLFAEYLNPLNGERSLTFADDIERQYKVRYSGRINPDEYPSWFKFVIPFKMSSPFIEGSFENVQIGSGTIENKGNVDTHIVIEIGGLAVNPSLTINGELLNYTGTIDAGKTLIIDTKNRTVKIDDINVLDNWCKKFPVLKAETAVNIEAGSNTIVKWRARWL